MLYFLIPQIKLQQNLSSLDIKNQTLHLTEIRLKSENLKVLRKQVLSSTLVNIVISRLLSKVNKTFDFITFYDYTLK